MNCSTAVLDGKGENRLLPRSPTKLKVLSYSGPTARYFPEAFRDPFRTHIYQNGEVLAITPCTLLGASITRDSEGKEWLIAVCKQGLEDVVFRRENVKNTVSSGWEEIGRIPAQPGAAEADLPWFFNGDGTQAQTMRSSPRTIVNSGFTPYWRDRYKITIDNASTVVFENLGNEVGTMTHVKDIACLVGSARVIFTLRKDIRSVIAVDYINKNQILGYMWMTGGGDQELETSSAGNTRTDVVKYDLASVSFLLWGNNALVVENQSFIRDSMLKLTDYKWQSRVFALKRDEYKAIIYFDMRDDVVVFQESVTEHIVDTGGIQHGYYISYQIKDLDSDAYRVLFKGGVKDIYENVNEIESVRTTNVGGPSACSGYPNENGVVTTITNPAATPPRVLDAYHLWASPRLFFSGAIDSNQNLFISMQYFDKDDVKQWFNFLSNGDPADIIPGAPSNPRYYPVYVIK